MYICCFNIYTYIIVYSSEAIDFVMLNLWTFEMPNLWTCKSYNMKTCAFQIATYHALALAYNMFHFLDSTWKYTTHLPTLPPTPTLYILSQMSTSDAQPGPVENQPAIELQVNAVPNAQVKPKHTWVKITRAQKDTSKENTEAMWEAIRLAQERAQKDINDLSESWNT